eukprot:TRINITY_DN12358_c0_g1_i1.p1 TRINITY_DN12358_c0_g1~~TRINITY_DN12358_c0_g1_i1.p1  ORF type:complete len:226 (+),score=12.67 TRINITY_DN12358_c0_g1_i1:50-727(+)
MFTPSYAMPSPWSSVYGTPSAFPNYFAPSVTPRQAVAHTVSPYQPQPFTFPSSATASPYYAAPTTTPAPSPYAPSYFGGVSLPYGAAPATPSPYYQYGAYGGVTAAAPTQVHLPFVVAPWAQAAISAYGAPQHTENHKHKPRREPPLPADFPVLPLRRFKSMPTQPANLWSPGHSFVHDPTLVYGEDLSNQVVDFSPYYSGSTEIEDFLRNPRNLSSRRSKSLGY